MYARVALYSVITHSSNKFEYIILLDLYRTMDKIWNTNLYKYTIKLCKLDINVQS